MEELATNDVNGARLFGEQYWQHARDFQDAVRERMAAPGALGLPELLEAKRFRYLIPDGFFDDTCVYDRILLCPLIEVEPEKKAGDTRIIMPQSAKEREEATAPIGIICSAGLQALDYLRAHGMDLGHTVRYVQFSITRVPCAWIKGKPLYGIPLRACDLFSSLDLTKEIRSGEKRIAFVDDEKNPLNGQHVIEVDGKQRAPLAPQPNEF